MKINFIDFFNVIKSNHEIKREKIAIIKNTQSLYFSIIK